MNNGSTSKTIWPKLRYHNVHAQLWKYSGRFAAIVAGRQSGKTELCMRKMVLQLPIKKPWPDPLYFYLYPTRDQAKQKAWDRFLQLIPPEWIVKDGINLTDRCIRTVWGSKLYITGSDKPHRLEGGPSDGVMIDESCDQKPGLFQRSIVPMLASRSGFCYRLGVPKRSGISKAEFKEFFDRGVDRKDGIASFHWKASEVLLPNEVDVLKSQLGELDYEEQINASWVDTGAGVYYSFTSENIRDDISYKPTEKILVGCDFNVNPMCWTLSHLIDDKFYVFDEVFLRNTNTQATLDYIFNKYYQHDAGWDFYGDATSRANKTSATYSDYLIIKNDVRFGHKYTFFPEKNPHLRDRFAAVNAACRNAKGDVRLYINNKCKHLIGDFNIVAYKEGTSEVEDYRGTDYDHTVSALGYMINIVAPVRLELSVAPAIYAA